MVATKITVVSDEHQNCVGWGKKEREKIEKRGFFFSFVHVQIQQKRSFAFSLLAVKYRDTVKQKLEPEL